MANAKYHENTEKIPRLTYLKSIGVSLIITVLVMLIIAAIVTFTSVSESVMPLLTSIIMILSIAFSGLLTASKFKKRGLMHGLITGAIYIFFILFLSWVLIKDFSMDKYVIIKGAFGVVSGGIGGMIGVNLK